MYDIADIIFYSRPEGIHLKRSFLIIYFCIGRYVFMLVFSLLRIFNHGIISMLFWEVWILNLQTFFIFLYLFSIFHLSNLLIFTLFAYLRRLMSKIYIINHFLSHFLWFFMFFSESGSTYLLISNNLINLFLKLIFISSIHMPFFLEEDYNILYCNDNLWYQDVISIRILFRIFWLSGCNVRNLGLLLINCLFWLQGWSVMSRLWVSIPYMLIWVIKIFYKHTYLTRLMFYMVNQSRRVIHFR